MNKTFIVFLFACVHTSMLAQVCTSTHMCHSMYADVRGQLEGMDYICLSCVGPKN